MGIYEISPMNLRSVCSKRTEVDQLN